MIWREREDGIGGDEASAILKKELNESLDDLTSYRHRMNYDLISLDTNFTRVY